ncbi:hypothetical protein H0H81_005330 [Sphagnurus paluster]|uniref:Uncharacterized protein n=1 Tax=Sphagnurus paluster TaxID=117069 RepID=A0A9P7GPQ0_9AGAR|nr:hypothetical protein H0H81_005330 [Sphagnurus paluster]
MFLACGSIYVGAFGSLPKPKSTNSSQDDDEDDEIPERMSSGDAWLFPVVSKKLNLVTTAG